MMIRLTAALIAATALAGPVVAQTARPILIVDTERVANDCTACKSAATQIQQKEAALRSRAQTLQTQLQTEGKPIQDAIDALNGKQPDAALQARITAFQTKERNANTELTNAQRTHQSTLVNVNQQISRRLLQVVEQVRARRSAAVVVAKNSTIASDAALDVTSEVLTALNAALPSVSVTPLPQQPAQTTPQGR